MVVYRLYFFESGGHIGHEAIFECVSEEAAVAAAEQYRDKHTMELWTGARLVKRFKAS